MYFRMRESMCGTVGWCRESLSAGSGESLPCLCGQLRQVWQDNTLMGKSGQKITLRFRGIKSILFRNYFVKMTGGAQAGDFPAGGARPGKIIGKEVWDL